MDVSRLSRRGLILTALAPLVYPLYRVAAHNGWIVVTRGARAVECGSCPVSQNPAEEISLLAIGDTGLPSSQRVSVVTMMGRLAEDSEPDAVLMLGDNFYEKGVQSVSDPRFETDFETAFDPRHFHCPFHPVLGNHDYLGNVLAQVDYTQLSDRWRMLGAFYKVRYGSAETSLDLFVIDTNSIHTGSPAAESQLKWLDNELSSSEASWKMVAGHHPCLSGGEHGPSEAVQRTIGPLLTRHNVALYLAGHEHDLQLLDSGQGWLQLISGSGSKLRSTSWIAETRYAAAVPGFVWLLFQKQQLSISIYDDHDRLFTNVISRPKPLDSHVSQLDGLARTEFV